MRILITAVSLLLLSLGASSARAHAFLSHASPLVGSTVSAAPQEVLLTFTQNFRGGSETTMLFGKWSGTEGPVVIALLNNNRSRSVTVQ